MTESERRLLEAGDALADAAITGARRDRRIAEKAWRALSRELKQESSDEPI